MRPFIFGSLVLLAACGGFPPQYDGGMGGGNGSVGYELNDVSFLYPLPSWPDRDRLLAMTSEGKQGDSAWSTRARWCKMYGKMGKDSVSIVIIDHPSNPNYPTYWHARGYGLFSANPLGENIFTNGKLTKNLTLKMGEAVIFRYRIVIDDGKKTLSAEALNALADAFAQKNAGRSK